MNRLARLDHHAGRIAEQLATGSTALTRRINTRTGAWIRKGYRHDLTGWRAALGCWLRLAVLGLGLYLLYRLLRAVPNLMWLLTAAWTAAAWRAGKTLAAGTAEEPEEETPAADPREAVHRLLLDVMGDASGVHLRAVLAHLQERGQWEDRTVTDLRRHLDRLQVPVHRGVKVAGVPTWGVRRRDLEAPSPAAAQETSTAASTAA